jgi:hydrogenase nickel incorporation protein HypA/HybF
MHELTITQSVVDAVLEKTGDRKVTTVRLKVGRLSGVVPDSVQFCFDLITAGTALEGASLEIEEPPGLAHCRGCGDDFGVADLLLLCECGSSNVEVKTGQELLISSVEVV